MHPSQLLGYLLPLATLLTASRAAVGTRDENAPAKQQPLTDPLYHKEPTHQAAQPEGGSPATEFPSQKDELLDLFTRPDPDVPGYSPLLDNPNLLVHWRPGGSIRVSQHLHIAKNGSITDSRYDKADYRWKPRSLPFCVDPHFPMAIVVMEPHGGAEGRPDRIQLFFTDFETIALRSIIWTASEGWYEDTAFGAMNIPHFAGSATTWRDPAQNLTQIRLFTHRLIYEPSGEEIKLRNGDVHTAGSAIYEFAWTTGKGWSASNGGDPIARSLCAVPFIARRGGGAVSVSRELMSLIFWDRPASSGEGPEESVPFKRVASWTAAGGWKVLGKTNFWLAKGPWPFGDVELSPDVNEALERKRKTG
ncbi:hypothetical protein ACEPPN_013188 [Leptodophora sp. 'Broadleaf-Isolate-01']